ncbi:MAG: HD family phosphohydrolase [Phycisphaerales bacterium]
MPQDGTTKTRAGATQLKRRRETRRSVSGARLSLRGFLLQREVINALGVFTVFLLLAGAVTVVSRNELRLEPGQVMNDARIKRRDFNVINTEDTEQRRREARENAPHVFTPNDPYLKSLRDALSRLPLALEGVSDFAEVAPELAKAFELNPERLSAVRAYVNAGEVDPKWTAWIEHIIDKGVVELPTLSSQDAQIEKLRRLPEFRVRGRDRLFREMWSVKDVVDGQEDLMSRWRRVVRDAGVPDALMPLIIARLRHDPQPGYLLNPDLTTQRAADEAAAVEISSTSHTKGDPIYVPGDVLTPEQLSVVQRERIEYEAHAPALSRWLHMLGVYGLVGLITAFLAGYLIRFYPAVIRNHWRVIAIAALCLAMLLISTSWSARAPGFLYAAAIATVLVASILMVIAYDQRLATMVAGQLCALTTLSLEQSIGFMILLMAVCGTAIGTLKQVRHRNTLIRTAFVTALVAGVGTILLGMFETPLANDQGVIPGVWAQIGADAGLAFVASLVVGFLLLGIMPSIERIFDMTTGLTLVELRDPRMPLLRQLQERAPGTYNHSLTVASIAESAADVIGADALLTYVGALYHDIGKMNKPEYFIENQEGGRNLHDKLSPAMSLLIIISHVKDGMELAREYNLPTPLLHFIEAHHGTTLVEYFYHAARSKAEADGDGERVEEFEFRYPGPRPRTKEAAILMLADACESSTRAMHDPGPASIEGLVRKLARKRLVDGQFDECDLTLRELSVIEDSIIRSIWALHHGRIAYPKGQVAREEQTRSDERPPSEKSVARRTAS